MATSIRALAVAASLAAAPALPAQQPDAIARPVVDEAMVVRLRELLARK